jgi:hypothetical protein
MREPGQFANVEHARHPRGTTATWAGADLI